MIFANNHFILTEEVEFDRLKVILQKESGRVYPAKEFVNYINSVKDTATSLYYLNNARSYADRVERHFGPTPEDSMIATCEALLYDIYSACKNAEQNPCDVFNK